MAKLVQHQIPNVTSAKSYEDSSIELTTTDPFEKKLEHRKRYMTIRGGLSWPTTQAPAYFCVLGQEFRMANSWEQTIPVGQRVILAEYASENLSLTKFYQRMIDIADQFLCSHFYVAIPDDSLLLTQLQGITREDLQNNPEEVFFGLNALRHVLGSYYRQPPTKTIRFRRQPSSGSLWAM